MPKKLTRALARQQRDSRKPPAALRLVVLEDADLECWIRPLPRRDQVKVGAWAHRYVTTRMDLPPDTPLDGNPEVQAEFSTSSLLASIASMVVDEDRQPVFASIDDGVDWFEGLTDNDAMALLSELGKSSEVPEDVEEGKGGSPKTGDSTPPTPSPTTAEPSPAS